MEKVFSLPLWFGVVERRDDNLKVGRCKVRIFNYHTADKASLSTDDLPWAYPTEPLSAAFFSTAREGDIVFGIFLDGENAQSPLILGKVPALSENAINHPTGEGYKDARTDEELPFYPRQLIQSYDYNLNGRGVVVREFDKALRHPVYGQVSSIPFLSLGQSNTIPEQINPETKKQHAAITRFITATGETWFEPPTFYAARYPFNAVYESESLHTMEFDDTPGAERVKLNHRLGTGFEFFPDGCRVEKIVRDNYTVILGDNFVGIVGAQNITVNGDASLFVRGDMTTHVNGDYRLSVDGNFYQKVRGKVLTETLTDSKHKVSGEYVLKSDETVTIKGASLQLNPSTSPSVDSILDFDLPAVPADSLSFLNQERLIEATGSVIAPTDDKDESAQSELEGETIANVAKPQIISCPFLSDENLQFNNGDARYRMQLSKYHQLADLTIRTLYPHHIQDQLGLLQDEIICNLAYIAQNSLDSIITKYPGARINSGFRKQQNGLSQHEKGEAVDLQWPLIGVGSLNKYLEIANWIKESVPFDQLILEHGNTVWLHISLKRIGVNRSQVLTMKDGFYTAGLSLMGRS